MKSTVFRTATATTAVIMLIACSNGANQVAPVSFDPVAPVVTIDPTTTIAPSSTTAAATTAPQTTIASTLDPTTTTMSPTEGLTGPMFSNALGIKVATAPGIHTAGDTRQLLPEGLYVHLAWESDPNDLSVFSPTPADIPILEAYANASLAYYRAFLTTVTTEAPEFALYYVDSGAKYEANFDQARRDGYIGSLGNGVILRPYVLGDQRSATTAVLLDCSLADESFILKGQTKELGPLETSGIVATMVRNDGSWKVDQIATEPHACV
jgi:hypothetical protein